MSKSCNNKVKNPCKICTQTVSNKNGLQCHGVCKRWAHYSCLKYTPGKIQDIKAGLIKIICPCPDCASVEPDPCDKKTKKRSVKKAKGGIPDCPSLSKKQRPIPPAPIQETCCTSDSSGSLEEKPCGPPCGTPEPCTAPKCPSKTKLKKKPSLTNSCCGPDNQCVTSTGINTKNKKDKKDLCSELSPITSSASSCSQPSFTKKTSRSCSCLSNESNGSPRKILSSSDSNIPGNNQLYAAMEEMCKTVGQLSVQLRDIMCEVIESLQKKNNRALLLCYFVLFLKIVFVLKFSFHNVKGTAVAVTL